MREHPANVPTGTCRLRSQGTDSTVARWPSAGSAGAEAFGISRALRAWNLSSARRRIGVVVVFSAFGLWAGCGTDFVTVPFYPDVVPADAADTSDGAGGDDTRPVPDADAESDAPEDTAPADIPDAVTPDADSDADIGGPDGGDAPDVADAADAIDADAAIDADTAIDGDGSGDADAAADADVTTDADSGPDVDAERLDVEGPPSCGDAIVQPPEECDDGNEIDDDECSNACIASFCGDGVLNATLGTMEFFSPVVTNPGGVSGYVCDDGASCPGLTCDVSENSEAPEHGICQSLGFDIALTATWGDGDGGESSPMPHAYNWSCFDYVCSASETDNTADDCSYWEMLGRIECRGIVGEECDDGEENGDTADRCRTDCTLPYCGDVIVDSGEECDDGNDVDDDGCSNDCLLPQCGDGVLNGEEECDDGNDVNSDLCRNDCLLPTCGDGLISEYEDVRTFEGPIVTNPFGARGHVCDDGATCEARACDVGDNPSAPEHGICQSLGYVRALSVRWGGGPGESDNPMPHAYNWACFSFACGPSSNTYSSDNCGTGEMLNTITCIRDYHEECDEGPENADVPGATCRTTCLLPHCGDGVVEGEEECDDGNDVQDDGCSNLCRLPQCGDGVVQGEEQCDDGNDVDTDGCRNTCVLPRCGDDVRSDSEECDLGEANSDEPDGACRTDCSRRRCGDGIPDSDEECDDGDASDTNWCTTGCTEARCGDGHRQRDVGEECDDGNAVSGDGCSSICLREGGGIGHVVFVGHDLFSSNPDVDRLVGNAVFLTEATGEVSVLGFDQYADTTSGGEAAHTDDAIRRRAATIGEPVTITRLSDHTRLDEVIDDYDVLVVYEQERSGPMATIGAAWAPILVDFLDRGGVLLVCDYSSGSWQILDASGVLDIESVRSFGTGRPVTIADPSSPVATGVTNPYMSTNGSTSIQTDEGNTVAAEASGGQVVVHLEW